MSRLTEIRKALQRSLLAIDAPAEFRVSTSKADYESTPGLTEQRFLVATTAHREAEEMLEELLDTTGAASVKQALEADRSLGGLVIDTSVIATTGVRAYPRAEDEPLIGAEWIVSTTLEGGA